MLKNIEIINKKNCNISKNKNKTKNVGKKSYRMRLQFNLILLDYFHNSNKLESNKHSRNNVKIENNKTEEILSLENQLLNEKNRIEKLNNDLIRKRCKVHLNFFL